MSTRVSCDGAVLLLCPPESSWACSGVRNQCSWCQRPVSSRCPSSTCLATAWTRCLPPSSSSGFPDSPTSTWSVPNISPPPPPALYLGSSTAQCLHGQFPTHPPHLHQALLQSHYPPLPPHSQSSRLNTCLVPEKSKLVCSFSQPPPPQPAPHPNSLFWRGEEKCFCWSFCCLWEVKRNGWLGINHQITYMLVKFIKTQNVKPAPFTVCFIFFPEWWLEVELASSVEDWTAEERNIFLWVVAWRLVLAVSGWMGWPVGLAGHCFSQGFAVICPEVTDLHGWSGITKTNSWLTPGAQWYVATVPLGQSSTLSSLVCCFKHCTQWWPLGCCGRWWRCWRRREVMWPSTTTYWPPRPAPLTASRTTSRTLASSPSSRPVRWFPSTTSRRHTGHFAGCLVCPFVLFCFSCLCCRSAWSCSWSGYKGATSELLLLSLTPLLP